MVACVTGLFERVGIERSGSGTCCDIVKQDRVTASVWIKNCSVEMGKGGKKEVASSSNQTVSWDEVRKHRAREDKWLVIEGQVYNITEWSKRHPGGSRLISHYAGQDATEAFRAFHNDHDFVRKYMKALHVGSVGETEQDKDETLKKDFEELRQTAQRMKLFTPSVCFFIVQFAHIIAFEILAYLTLYYWGTGWLPWLVSVMCYSIVEAQSGWTQHDFGHLSVFNSTRFNHWMHQYIMCFTKGASCDWWNHLHYQHHAKPNVLYKDPDVRLEAVFVLGETMPKRVAKERKTSPPYNWQHRYFFAVGPPLLFPVYFQYMVFYHAISRKKWVDLIVMLGFYFKFFYLYSGLLGWGVIPYYLAFRIVGSHWFVWVSQSNHIPMEIEDDKERCWVPLQMYATCDVEKSFFNDWFTGHLNFQIEHHLFPTMPRHNLYKIAPLVQTLCKKHNIPYTVKPLGTAFGDIVRALKHSGEIWHAYYEAYHHM